jgi:hypothetical protein
MDISFLLFFVYATLAIIASITFLTITLVGLRKLTYYLTEKFRWARARRKNLWWRWNKKEGDWEPTVDPFFRANEISKYPPCPEYDDSHPTPQWIKDSIPQWIKDLTL